LFFGGKKLLQQIETDEMLGRPSGIELDETLKMWGKSVSLCDSDLLEKTFQNLSHFAKHWLGTSSEKLVSLGLEVGAHSPLSGAGSRSLQTRTSNHHVFIGKSHNNESYPLVN
jgi:hypothetical protein